MRRRFVSVALALASGWTYGTIQAAENVPLVTGPLSPGDQGKLEVEIVEIGKFRAAPNVIHRKPGKFILVIVNEKGDPADLFVFAPNGAASAVAHWAEERLERALPGLSSTCRPGISKSSPARPVRFFAKSRSDEYGKEDRRVLASTCSRCSCDDR
jgi:hypothetical protein